MSFTRIGRPEFIQKLHTLERAIMNDRSTLITCDLKPVSRYSFSWVLLSLCKPFYALFGKDPFSHVRIDRVAHNLLEFCRINKHVFLHEENLIERIEKNILDPLNQKTRWAYSNAVQGAKAGMRGLLPSEVERSLPNVALTESHYEGKWPVDLGVLNITPREKAQIQHALFTIYTLHEQRIGVQMVKKLTKVTENTVRVTREIVALQNDRKKVYPISHTLMIVQNTENELPDVFLFSKKVLAKGGDRKVRVCWNLTTGEPYVHKPIMSPTKSLEAKVLSILSNHGLLFHQWEKVNSGLSLPSKTCPKIENDNYRASMIEPLFEGSLDKFLQAPGFRSVVSRIEVLRGVLNIIAQFQKFTCSQELSSTGRIVKSAATHGDISLKNIIISMNTKYTKWCLIDFAQSGNLMNATHTPGFLSPEYVAFYGQNHTADTLLSFNAEHLHGKDIWAAGIVGAILLSGLRAIERQDIFLPAMNFTEEAQKALRSEKEMSNLRKYNPLVKLSQHEIDLNIKALRDLVQATEAPERQLITSAWEVIRLMLQVDPKKRIDARNAEQMLTEALQTYLK